MTYRIIEVAPTEGRWRVTDLAGWHGSTEMDRKDDAIEYGKRLAKVVKPSLLVIRNDEGSIESEIRFGVAPRDSASNPGTRGS